MLAVWVIAAGITGPFGGRLPSVEKNDQSSFLPASAQSTQALELQKRFFGKNQPIPAVVVFRRADGLTRSDYEKVMQDRQAVAKLGTRGIGVPSPPVPSRDGKALLFTVPIKASSDDPSVLQNAVSAIRRTVEKDTGGLAVAVTGPAGFTSDLVEVFGGIDTKLLFATALVVAALLLLTYRSPFLWLLPLVSVGLAEGISQAVYYGLAGAGITISGQTAGLATVLLFGAGTDYALLLVARYREELRRHEDRHEAMAYALRQAGPAILASAGTVTIGLLCLLASELNNNRGLGPVGAAAVLLALLAMLTALPALLLVLGRGVFWPYVPRYGTPSREEAGVFFRLGRTISARKRFVWVTTAVVLAILAFGLVRLDTGLTPQQGFRGKVDSVEGQKLLAKSYPAGASAPATVVVRPADRAREVREAARKVGDTSRIGPIEKRGGVARFDVTLASGPYSQKSFGAVKELREKLGKINGVEAYVGGTTAQQLDTRQAAARDSEVIVPLVLLVVLVILGLLLRSVVAPVILIATVILSFAAALGVSVVVFESLFGFPGIDPSLPLLAFVFLVALGVDYNIFLVARAREEAGRHGTREGMLRALAVTGGVITSAGIVLAATFSVLGVLPLVVLTEIGFIVAFGVLLDTLVVRSVLVPAIVMDAGKRFWWPSNPEEDRSPRY